MIVAFVAGTAGLRCFVSRLLLWRGSLGWYAFILPGVPLLFYASAAAQGFPLAPPTPFASVSALISALFFMAIKGPVEEIGWRGLALPLLQRKVAPIWAGLILGVIWGVWHLPAFVLSGMPQSEWSFTAFFLGAVAISVIVTPMFNQSRGSILLSLPTSGLASTGRHSMRPGSGSVSPGASVACVPDDGSVGSAVSGAQGSCGSGVPRPGWGRAADPFCD